MQTWIDDKHVAIGTKCNKLLCMNVETFYMMEVPMPPKPPRPQAVPLDQTEHNGCGIHGISLSPDGSMLACGGAEASDCQIFHVDQRPGQPPRFAPHQTLVVQKLPVGML